ncbi:MAG: Zn-finger nucleic acid-binding protein [Candidatus Azotimanducaceae bacterium]|jgi:Zn-finger nucleic acid-binding protein
MFKALAFVTPPLVQLAPIVYSEFQMNCPKCESTFEHIVFNNIEIDRCSHCKGLWFDMLEKEDLVKMKGAESIDIGDEQVGKQFSEIRNINCPDCSRSMIPMVDKDQFHIKYEYCPNCFGTFFDAGEFRDLKENSVLERFMQMLQTVRTNISAERDQHE